MGTMSLALLILIQVQESPRLSKTAMVAAALVFILGVSLLVYFFRKYKRTEKEMQDEWARPEQSLFAGSLPSLDQGERPSMQGAASADAIVSEQLEPDSGPRSEPDAIPAAVEAQAPVAAEPLTQEPRSEEPPVILAPIPDLEITQRQTEVLSSEKIEAASVETEVPPPVSDLAADSEITRQHTEVLSSKKEPDSSKIDTITESISFDDDIWEGLEFPEPEVPAATQPLGADRTTLAGSIGQPSQASVPEAGEAVNPPPNTELLGAARVDSPSGRERFEPPGFTQTVHGKALEPPRIDRAAERRTRILASEPAVSGQPGEAEGVAEVGASSAEAPILAPAAANSAANIRVRAGSILGLPAERSQAPLVLGAPVKPRDELGIGALSNYGRDVEGGGGHGGTITLATVILLLGGGIAVYLFVPSVNSRVNAVVQRARGIDPNPPAAVELPKARVFAARNEANKNMVKARGAVDNISEESLHDLKLEVSLERGNDVPGELRTVPIKPSQLAPKERGTFEFEYDGNRATGFGGYRIVRLLSGETEIKFVTPGRSG